jgi:hypothetical protein
VIFPAAVATTAAHHRRGRSGGPGAGHAGRPLLGLR